MFIALGFLRSLHAEGVMLQAKLGGTGQVGQMHVFCSEMHMKLFPTKQKTCSCAFLAQVV